MIKASKSKSDAAKKPAAAAKKKAAVSAAPGKPPEAARKSAPAAKSTAKPVGAVTPVSKQTPVLKPAAVSAIKAAQKPRTPPAERAAVDWSNAIATALQKKQEQKSWPGGGEAWKGKKRSRF